MCEEQKDIVDQLISIGRPASEDDNRVQMEGMYLTNREAAYHPYVSPLLALSHKGVARALCVSAEFDGLRLQTSSFDRSKRRSSRWRKEYRKSEIVMSIPECRFVLTRLNRGRRRQLAETEYG